MKSHPFKSSKPQRYVDSGHSMHGSWISAAFDEELEEEHVDDVEMEDEAVGVEAHEANMSWGRIMGTSSVQNPGDLLRNASEAVLGMFSSTCPSAAFSEELPEQGFSCSSILSAKAPACCCS